LKIKLIESEDSRSSAFAPLSIFIFQSSAPPCFKMAELMFSLGQTKSIKNTKAKVTDTKNKLKDVKITETVETNDRKEKHIRELASKEVSRAQKKKNMDVNITGVYWFLIIDVVQCGPHDVQGKNNRGSLESDDFRKHNNHDLTLSSSFVIIVVYGIAERNRHCRGWYSKRPASTWDQT